MCNVPLGRLTGLKKYPTQLLTMSTTALLLTILLLAGLGVAFWWLFLKKPPEPTEDFPENWRVILLDKVRFYKELEAAERERFEKSIQRFFLDVQITGVNVAVDDTDRLLVAASAVIPLFGFPDWRYRNLNEVLLYEGMFNHDYQTTEGEDRNVLGMVGSGEMNRMMILSKPALHQGFAQSGRSNVGIHEFVHLLDKIDGSTDGVPEKLLADQYTIPWLQLVHREIHAIKKGDSDINVYGATNEAEFFSVASEYFFNRPQFLEEKHPELYAMLEKIFRQAPADARIG